MEKLHLELANQKGGADTGQGKKTHGQRLAEASGKTVACDKSVRTACDQVLKAETQVEELHKKCAKDGGAEAG